MVGLRQAVKVGQRPGPRLGRGLEQCVRAVCVFIETTLWFFYYFHYYQIHPFYLRYLHVAFPYIQMLVTGICV